jgi:hypothetical protein
MRDGLFNYVELGQLLAKYNQALRPHFAAPVGVKAGRQIEYLYLDKVPHLMVNGITGSGKTNVIRVWLATWCQFFSPDEIRFILVDLKRSGDLNHFADVPHLLHSIVKEINELEELMPRLVALMHRRMQQLSANNATDIVQYNSRVSPELRMERVVVLVDEVGSIRDLAVSAQQRDTIFRCLILMTAQARAAGIHVLVGTQQPGKEAIPSRITNNITYTLSGRQRTTSGAMQALGNNRLKDLPAIQGRMLVDNGFAYIQVQTPYATERDIRRAVEIARSYPAARPFELPSLEEASDVLETVEVAAPAGVTRERVVELAITELGGSLSAQKIWDMTAGVTPRNTILDLIKALAEDKEVDYDGHRYEVKRAGKGYKLVRMAETQNAGGADDSLFDSDTADFQSDEPETEDELREAV